MAAIRAWWSQSGAALKLRDYGIRMELTPKDIAALAVRAVKWQGRQGAQPALAEQREIASDTPAFPLGQVDQIDTPAFKTWYGDWQNAADGKPTDATHPGRAAARPAGDGRGLDVGGGRDVDAVQRRAGLDQDTALSTTVGQARFPGSSGPVEKDGSPLALYHGTRDDVESFDLAHPNRKDGGWLGRGVYASSSADQAEIYANQKRGAGNPRIMPLYMAVKNPYIITNAQKTRMKGASQAQIDRFTNSLKDLGHDGVVMDIGDADGHVELVAFDPVDVKSATGNVGAFGQRPITAQEAENMGMTEAQADGDIRFSRASTIGHTLNRLLKYLGTESAEMLPQAFI